ncbi:UNVERIFIED_CONTAM: hypothetical protein K2H54_053350 [Gekko kuhli]
MSNVNQFGALAQQWWSRPYCIIPPSCPCIAHRSPSVWYCSYNYHLKPKVENISRGSQQRRFLLWGVTCGARVSYLDAALLLQSRRGSCRLFLLEEKSYRIF